MRKYKSDYIPRREAEIVVWADNFAKILAANTAEYQVTGGVAEAVTSIVNEFLAAYDTANEPTTRTRPAVAAKDQALAAMLLNVRPVATAIAGNPTISDEAKRDLGVTVRMNTRPRIPAPVVAPVVALRAAIPGQLNLSIRQAEDNGNRAKPLGTIGYEMAAVIGTAHTVDPDQAPIVLQGTRALLHWATPAESAGQKVSIFARYINRSGPGGQAQVGPWSAPLQTYVL